MTPTPNLRFIERDNQIGSMIATYKVLQQWWEYSLEDGDPHEGGAWHDVELVKEATCV